MTTTGQGLFGLEEIRAVLLFTGRTPFTNAGMMGHIIVIQPTVTVVAEEGFANESAEGITPIVEFTFFDEVNDFI